MPYDSDDFKVVLGYFKDGKFVEVPLEDVEFVEEEEEKGNEFAPIAKLYHDVYSAFIDEGFEKNHAFSFTRDVIKEIKEAYNAAED